MQIGRNNFPLEFASIRRRPAKKRPQSLCRIELEDPAFRFLAQVKPAQTRQRDALTSFETLIQSFDKAIHPGSCCCFIGMHMCSKPTGKLVFTNAISHGTSLFSILAS